MVKTIGLFLVLYGSALIGQAARAPRSPVTAVYALPGLPPFDCDGCCEWNDSCAPGCNNQGCKDIAEPPFKRRPAGR